VKFEGIRGKINVFVDLMMDLDDQGKRFEQWSAARPFSLCVGAELFVRNAEKLGRFSQLVVVVDERPLNKFSADLGRLLEECVEHIATFSEGSLRSHGRFVELPQHYAR
jgi:hypothetical protein